MTHRCLTVTGAVNEPMTVTVPIGTPLRETLALAGGLSIPAADAAFIDGGPMMGGTGVAPAAPADSGG